MTNKNNAKESQKYSENTHFVTESGASYNASRFECAPCKPFVPCSCCQQICTEPCEQSCPQKLCNSQKPCCPQILCCPHAPCCSHTPCCLEAPCCSRAACFSQAPCCSEAPCCSRVPCCNAVWPSTTMGTCLHPTNEYFSYYYQHPCYNPPVSVLCQRPYPCVQQCMIPSFLLPYCNPQRPTGDCSNPFFNCFALQCPVGHPNAEVFGAGCMCNCNNKKPEQQNEEDKNKCKTKDLKQKKKKSKTRSRSVGASTISRAAEVFFPKERRNYCFDHNNVSNEVHQFPDSCNDLQCEWKECWSAVERQPRSQINKSSVQAYESQVKGTKPQTVLSSTKGTKPCDRSLDIAPNRTNETDQNSWNVNPCKPKF